MEIQPAHGQRGSRVVVEAVETAVVVVCLSVQLVQGNADLRRGVAALRQINCEESFLDIAVALAVSPVAEVAVAKLIAEQGDNAVLCNAFGFAYVAHVIPSAA